MTVRSVMRKKTVSALVLAAAVAMTSSACARSGPPPVQIGLKRVALDLAFKDEEKKEAPKPPIVIEEILPAIDFGPSPSVGSIRAPRVTPLPKFNLCPKATEDAVPEQPVSVFATKPPEMGVYQAFFNGAIDLSVGPLVVKLPIPNIPTTIEYRNLVTAEQAENPLQPAGVYHTYEQVIKLGTTTIVRTLQMRVGRGQNDIQLLKEETKSEQGDNVFVPTPTLTYYQMKGEGTGQVPGTDQWNVAGVDTTTSRVMTILGSNKKRELVDVCGTVFDTYRVESKERVVSLNPLAPPYASNTREDEGKPNAFNIANHLGGLIVRQEFHTTTTSTTKDNLPYTLKLDVTITLAKVKPLGPGEKPISL